MKASKTILLDTFLLWWFCSYTTITFFFKFLYMKSWSQIGNEFIESLLKLFPNKIALYVTSELAFTVLIVYFPYRFIKYEFKSTLEDSKRRIDRSKYLQPFLTDINTWKNNKLTISAKIISKVAKIFQNFFSFIQKNIKVSFEIMVELILLLIIIHERFNQGTACTFALVFFPITTAYLLQSALPIIIGFDKKRAALSSNMIIRLIGLISFGITLLQLVK